MTLPCKVGVLIVSAALLHGDLDSLAPQKELGLYATATSEKNMAVVSGGKMAFVPLPLEDARDMERARTVRLQLRPLVVEAGEQSRPNTRTDRDNLSARPRRRGDRITIQRSRLRCPSPHFRHRGAAADPGRLIWRAFRQGHMGSRRRDCRNVGIEMDSLLGGSE